MKEPSNFKPEEWNSAHSYKSSTPPPLHLVRDALPSDAVLPPEQQALLDDFGLEAPHISISPLVNKRLARAGLVLGVDAVRLCEGVQELELEKATPVEIRPADPEQNENCAMELQPERKPDKINLYVGNKLDDSLYEAEINREFWLGILAARHLQHNGLAQKSQLSVDKANKRRRVINALRPYATGQAIIQSPFFVELATNASIGILPRVGMFATGLAAQWHMIVRTKAFPELNLIERVEYEHQQQATDIAARLPVLRLQENPEPLDKYINS